LWARAWQTHDGNVNSPAAFEHFDQIVSFAAMDSEKVMSPISMPEKVMSPFP
jgi:hypothetical protein